jgi:hypothetical protein
MNWVVLAGESREDCQSEVQFPAFARERLDPGFNHFFNKLSYFIHRVIQCVCRYTALADLTHVFKVFTGECALAVMEKYSAMHCSKHTTVRAQTRNHL